MVDKSIRIVLWCILLALLFDIAVGATEEGEDDVASDDECRLVLVLSSLIAGMDSDDERVDRPARKQSPREKPRYRVRRSVQSIFQEHGAYYVRRAYRMSEESFWKLHLMLKPFMGSIRKKGRGKQKRHRNGGKNGLIPSEARLSAAIRYFAGGRPADISISHGISHSEVFYSCWRVVDAVNACPDLVFGFPSCHEKQKELALAFQSSSRANIDCCVGALDGILIWIERPSAADCLEAGCGPKKFFCGRKHKFGLNMQGVCDADGKFLDVSIGHPASTSDFLAFTTSDFHKKIETPGYLSPGLCVFGDSAYVNNSYFVTPFKNVKSGVRDVFNFYQSQLRIKIECAFGMFVARWGLLRRALPQAMRLRKITALTLCLCRLHNFCIGQGQRVDTPLASDTMEILAHGGIALDNSCTPEGLLHGGEHHEDTTRSFRQNFGRNTLLASSCLPRDKLVAMIERNGFERPTPKSWSRLPAPAL
jgi:hypothetical protein